MSDNLPPPPSTPENAAAVAAERKANTLALNHADKKSDLISRLQDEADLCRNEGADDIAALLDEAAAAVAAEKHWRETVDDMLSVCHMVASNDPRESIDRLIDWHCSVYIDPLVSSDAAALVARTLRTASCAATIDVNSCGGKRARYWGLTIV